ncbi:U5 small nuclear ribonucleoprotein 40 kDa protein-like [Convolutriloba macropyga]|uniref:U5 small nuclear ribonucleoprotein 40 kDa protein-like n=1 Tax=Convolutriloba macropyga TaxID=536237 RepID=UPI003F51E488
MAQSYPVAMDTSALVPSFNKAPRTDLTLYSGNVRREVVKSGPARTSSLLSPIMALSGHEGEILTTKFHPNGQYLCSGSFDRLIYLWNVYGECNNFAVLKGHTGPVVQLSFSPDGQYMFTASTDKTGAVWDIETGERIKRLKGHTSFVNTVDSSRKGDQLIASGSDDGTIKVFDIRRKDPIKNFNNTYQVTSVAFSENVDQVFSGGIENEIKVWDLRRDSCVNSLKGHTDTVTSLSLSPDGCYLLSNSMDNTVRIFDVRPFAPIERCVKVFLGAQHNFEKNLIKANWHKSGNRVACGSADKFVYVWDVVSRRIMYKLPGHNGSVNEVDFHPTEPIIASGASDKVIYLGELNL